MSEKVDRFVDGLRTHLTNIEERLTAIRENFQNAVGEQEDAIDAKRKELQSKVDEHYEAVAEKRRDLQARAAKLKEGLEERVAEWKAQRKLDRLDERASDAEAYARLAIAVAVDTLDDAELATLVAISARFDAEAARTAKAA